MAEREGGFIVIWRQVQSSALFLSLTAEQRSVMLSILLLANWKDTQAFVGGTWETIHRGEIMRSLASIAEHAKVSIKVVRSALTKMFADDRPVGGRGPFLTERWIGSGREVGIGSGIAAGTVPGTAVGTPIRVLTVVNYDEYQSVAEDEGTGSGTLTDSVTGTLGARDGHDRGTIRTKGTIGTSTASSAQSPADAGSAPQVALLAAPEEPAVFTMSCVGTGAKEFAVTESMLGEWSEAFPGVDVRGEVRRAIQWTRDNPTRRKTATGARKFLSGWLSRAQNNPAAPKAVVAAAGPTIHNIRRLT